MVKLAADIGCIGLGTLSQNLILNLDDHGYIVAVYDKYTKIVAALADHEAKDTNILCTYSLEEMIDSLKTNPRIIMLRESATLYPELVDDLIEKLEPLLSSGDIIIDYSDSCPSHTARRFEDLNSKNILFVGCGINDDENEARRGPLLTLGGNSKAWPFIKPIFQKICSKIDEEPSCHWLGEGSIGHQIMRSYTIHLMNEGDLMLEAYYLMRYRLDMDNKEIGCIFSEWNTGNMKSALFETIINILNDCDDDDDPLEIYKSKSGKVGSGLWTAVMSDYHVDMGSIFYFYLCRLLKPPNYIRTDSSSNYEGNKEEVLVHLKNALYAATVHTYCEDVKNNIVLHYVIRQIYSSTLCSRILGIWKGSSNTRCGIVNRLAADIERFPDFSKYDGGNLWSDDFFTKAVEDNLPAIHKIVTVSYDLDIDLINFKYHMSKCDKHYSKLRSVYFMESVDLEPEY